MAALAVRAAPARRRLALVLLLVGCWRAAEARRSSGLLQVEAQRAAEGEEHEGAEGPMTVRHYASEGTHGPDLSSFGLPELEKTGAPFRRVNVSQALHYSQALDYMLGPAREPMEVRNPSLCEDECRKFNYRRVKTSPADVQSLRILVMLDSHCYTDERMDYELEEFCNHPAAFEQNEKCARGLPYAYYNDNFNHQREIKGYYKSAYTALFRRAIPYLRQKGWTNITSIAWNDELFETARQTEKPELWREVMDAEVIIVSIDHFRENLIEVYPDKRYILIATNDAATLSMDLGCDIEDGRIIAVLQHTALNPIAENNGELRGNRRHFMWFPANETRDRVMPTTYRIPELDQEGAEKIKVLIPQVYRWRWPLDCGGRSEFVKLQPSFHHNYGEYVEKFAQRWGAGRPPEWEIDREVFIPYNLRKYDITYIGTINHGNTRELYGVNEHRQMAVNAIRRLKQTYPDLRVYISHDKINYSTFINIIKDSKIFVSPFGLGEFSGKDYEAALSGTLVVKPAAEKLVSYPNIYLDNSTINVKIDFSDLEEAVMPFILSNSKAKRRIQDIIERLKEYSNMEAVSNDIHRFMMSALVKPVSFDPRGCYHSPTWFFTQTGRRKPSLVIAHVAAKRARAGLEFYDPPPVTDGDEIWERLQDVERRREAGLPAHDYLSKAPKISATSRHTTALQSYSDIVHAWIPWIH